MADGDTGARRCTGVRLGSVERAIVRAVERNGGFASRANVLRSAFPDLNGQLPLAVSDRAGAAHAGERRALAEAAVSRAIASLQRKGLVVRDRNPVTGRTLLRLPAVQREPVWEQVARAEEDFSAHASAMARHWRSLSALARDRALRLRADGSTADTDERRRLDIALAPQTTAHAVPLEAAVPAARLPARMGSAGAR